MRSARLRPSPKRTARNSSVAPRVAPATLNATPGQSPKRNPPVSVAIVAPGTDRPTMAA